MDCRCRITPSSTCAASTPRRATSSSWSSRRAIRSSRSKRLAGFWRRWVPVRSLMFTGNETRNQKPETRRAARPSGRLFVLLLVSGFCFLVSTSCRQKMANQPRYDPLETSDFFADGMSARPRIAGTVARGELSTDPFFDTGKINGALANGYPFAVTREVIDRGHQRYDIYCSECHGRVGDGNGMIPSRGYRR